MCAPMHISHLCVHPAYKSNFPMYGFPIFFEKIDNFLKPDDVPPPWPQRGALNSKMTKMSYKSLMSARDE